MGECGYCGIELPPHHPRPGGRPREYCTDSHRVMASMLRTAERQAREQGAAVNEWQQHVGVGERSNAFITGGDTRRRPVITDEGPNRGEVGGYQTDHKDGRVDAHVFAPCTSTRTKVQED